MKALIHIGSGDSRETYEYVRGKMLNVEFGAMERVTGMIGEDLERALDKAGQNAITALIWVLRKRMNPRAKLEEVVFEVGELVVEIVNDDGSPVDDDAEPGSEVALSVESESEPEDPKAETVD